jgi:hypothetical protein
MHIQNHSSWINNENHLVGENYSSSTTTYTAEEWLSIFVCGRIDFSLASGLGSRAFTLCYTNLPSRPYLPPAWALSAQPHLYAYSIPGSYTPPSNSLFSIQNKVHYSLIILIETGFSRFGAEPNAIFFFFFLF